MVTMEDHDNRQDGDQQGNLARAPACDNCKDRKTKCDRGSPCSSCVTANLSCRLTRTRPERRQRIIISAKYDEALERVDNRLQEVLDSIHSINIDANLPRQTSGSHQQVQHGGEFQRASDFFPIHDPTPSPVSTLFTPHAGSRSFRGDSSLDAQVGRMAATLGDSSPDRFLSAPHYPVVTFPQVPRFGARVTSETALPLSQQHPELAERALPPGDPVLRLLRLTQAEKQRFFVDVVLFDEQHFIELCRDVFFAIKPYTIYTWTIVHVGLFYLFQGLHADNYADVGVDAVKIKEITELLAKNAQAAVDNFRACVDPSLEACQAMALLGTYCMKSGQINKAWSMFSACSRMCIDLGLHRLPPGPPSPEDMAGHMVLWHVFVMEKGLALTLGRTQSLHHYDVSNQRPYDSGDLPGIPGKVYFASLELTLLEGEMMPQLLSASAQRLPLSGRAYKAKEFRTRIQQIQAGLSKAHGSILDPTPFGEAAILVDFLLHSVITVVCSSVALEESPGFPPTSQPGHACVDCIDAARKALAIVVRAGSSMKDAKPQGWAMFANMLLSMSPFTPYVVLAVHVVSEYSSLDMELLGSVNAVLEPVAERSQHVRDTLDTCMKLYRFAKAAAHPAAVDASAERQSLMHTAHLFGQNASLFVDSPDSRAVFPSTESVSPADGPAAPSTSMGDWQMMHGELDLDVIWRNPQLFK